MANLTNATSPRNGTNSLLLCARALAEFFAEHQSFLNVPRENAAIFTLIILVKNAIVCYGISTTLPLPVTIQLLVALTGFSLVLLAGSYVLNFTIIWGSFAAILCFRSRVIRLPAIPRFLISIATLCVAPIYFRVPCTLECVVDILLIVHVSCYILKTFLGPVEYIFAHFVAVVTLIMIFLAVDIAFAAKGFEFIRLVIVFVFFPIVYDAFRRREMIFFFVFLFIEIYCLYEQYVIYGIGPTKITRDEEIPTNYSLFPKA